jgi:hypothetical protein
MLGSGASGDRPLKGYMEHLMVSMGTTSAALREFAHGTTGSVSTDQFAGDYTVYAMSMNGPLGSSLFPCENAKRVISTVVFTDPIGGRLGVANISRESTSVHGVSMFTGINGGHSKCNNFRTCGLKKGKGKFGGSQYFVSDWFNRYARNLCRTSRFSNTICWFFCVFLRSHIHFLAHHQQCIGASQHIR